MKENILERGRLSSTWEALRRGENIPGVLDMHKKKKKSKVATKLAEKLGRIVENQGKTKGNQTFPFPVVPTRALLSSWSDNEGNIKEMGGKYTRTILGDIPPGRNYSRGMGDARYPSETLKPD